MPQATLQIARCAVLYPAIAEAARRAGATMINLIDIESSPGLNLQVDHVGIAYSTGESLGDPQSPVQLSASIVGHRPVPSHALPMVAARRALGRKPCDLRDASELDRLRAATAPDQTGHLEGSIALTAAHPPLLLPGDPLDTLPDALTRAPADALSVVTTTWALSRFSVERRLRFLQRLQDAGAGRTVAWVSVEGVGVAPAVPTFGDRRASGHSIIGLAILDQSALQTEAIGRCWSRGRLLSWLAAP